MSEFYIVQNRIPESVNPTHVARVWKADGTLFDVTDFASGDYDIDVYDDELTSILGTTGNSVGAGGAGDGPLFNALKTDGNWGNKDATGYNWLKTLTQNGDLAANQYKGGRRYLVVYSLNTDSDGIVPLVFQDTVFRVKPV